MSTILTPLVAPSTVRGKIVFPSRPPQVPFPAPSFVAAGALPPTQYFVQITWLIQTQDGALFESLPSDEVSVLVPANNQLVVASPAALAMPYALIGWNCYVATAPGAETLQNTTPNAVGSNFQLPGAPTLASPPPPSSWGQTLVFTYPPREVPSYNPNWIGHDEFSTGGYQQSVTWYVDELVEFRMDYIADGDDVSAWQQFLKVAIKRVPFDFYVDSTQGHYVTTILTAQNPKIAYKAPGLYSLDVKGRKAVYSP